MNEKHEFIMNNGILSSYYGPGGDVVIPSGVMKIDRRAFSYCRNIRSITIPDSVECIERYAFTNCIGLEEVHITDLLAWCRIRFVDSESNPLCYAHHLFINGEEIKDLIIPKGAAGIGDYAFLGCTEITSVTIPDSMESIGYRAFSDCTKLAAVHISDLDAWLHISYKGVGSNPLSNAHHLLLNGEEITSVSLPDGLTSIGRYLLDGFQELTSVMIPDSITHIENGAFYDCKGLTSITIPQSVTHIGLFAFSGCEGLTEVHVSDLSAWCHIKFEDASSNPMIYAHHFFLNGVELKELSIPDDITSIGAYSFVNCGEMTSLTIHAGIKSIGKMAFNGCTQLSEVYIADSNTLIGEGAFDKCPQVHVRFPEGNLEDKYYTICEKNVSTLQTKDKPPVYLRPEIYSSDTADAVRKEAAGWVLLYKWSSGSDYGYSSRSEESGSRVIPVPDSEAADLLVEEGRFAGILMRSKGSSFNKWNFVYNDLHATLIRNYKGDPIHCASGGTSFSSDDHESWDTYDYYLKPADHNDVPGED